jgi:hypothetical protein
LILGKLQTLPAPVEQLHQPKPADVASERLQTDSHIFAFTRWDVIPVLGALLCFYNTYRAEHHFRPKVPSRPTRSASSIPICRGGIAADALERAPTNQQFAQLQLTRRCSIERIFAKHRDVKGQSTDAIESFSRMRGRLTRTSTRSDKSPR